MGMVKYKLNGKAVTSVYDYYFTIEEDGMPIAYYFRVGKDERYIVNIEDIISISHNDTESHRL